MFDFKKKIENNIFNKSNNFRKDHKELNYVLIVDFPWSYKDIMEAPIPFMLEMIEIHRKQKEKEKKTMRRKR
ncbi:hypothetical protein [uncultured Arcobacter sp.]|uniref:hypothetical protein n=1 Tax=uncultured Arcobacter sp. TaxID=165434 RepID=UPI002620ED0B|nr:hypothetical protein [uncultured Arcobacter sp.]